MNGADLAYAAGWRLVRMLPGPVAAGAFRAGADIARRKGGRGVDRLAQNLRRVVGPDLSDGDFARLMRDAMRSYMRYYMEAFRLPSRSREQQRTDFRLEPEGELAAAIAAGKGVIVALPHAGNWDAAGAYVAANGWKIATVAERLKPERLYRRFLAFREGLGMEIIPASGGDRAPLEVLTERVREGYVVPLLADRDLPGRGVEVTFFGARTTMPPGCALLALRTGAPLYVCEMWYDRQGPRGRLMGPLEMPVDGPLDQRVRELTQRIADSLAAGIARHPADWHMLQRMWREPVAAGTASR